MSQRVGKWEDGWVATSMDKCIGWVGRKMRGWMSERMSGLMITWMDRMMEDWVDGWMVTKWMMD